MSNILEQYKKSPFANIGNKLSNLTAKEYKIPTDVNSDKNVDEKSILEIQKDFNEIIVPQYKTLLEFNSIFGNIKVNPTKPIIDLFSKFNIPTPVQLSSETQLLKLNSMFDDIKQMESSTEDKLLSILPISLPQESSVLNSNLAEIKLSKESNLLNSPIVDYVKFEQSDILKLNSIFDDIIDFKTTSVLNFNSSFDDIIQLPYSDVLSLNSRFDDIVIKDIGSVLKLYIASRLPGTIPGVANFFDDVYNTGFTLNASGGQSLFDYSKIPSFVPMEQTPEKPIVDIDSIPETPEKTMAELNPMPEPIDKPISDINPPAKTLEKPTVLINAPDVTPEKTGVDVFDGIETPDKIGLDVFDGIETPDKIGLDPIPMSDGKEKPVPDIQVRGQGVDFIKTDVATGFTLDASRNGTEYNFGKSPNLYGFNFNDDSYGGVLNQYAIYFATRGKVTDLSYKQIIDWAYKQSILVPEANDLYNKGFHTPKVPINQLQLIVPPYISGNERLPTWANTYISTLEDIGSTLVAGFLNQRTIELIDTIVDVDMSPLKTSPVIFHQLSGEIYWKYHEFGNIIRDARETVINIASDFVGETLARQFVPKVENTIGNATANLINGLLNAPLIDGEDILRLYHILMGTKYTKSKAFFDRTVPFYSSIASKTGETAINLYDDSNPYTQYASMESTDALSQNIISVPEQLSTTVRNIATKAGTSIEISGQTEQDNRQSPLKSLWYNISERASSDFKIPVGYKEPGLKNEFLMKKDSATFGDVKISEKNSPVNTPIEDRIFNYDGPVNIGSLDSNYPTDDVLNEGGIQKVKGDLTSLVNNNISKFKNVLSTDFSIADTILSTKHTKDGTYTQQITERLSGQGKLLNERGFPSIGTQFSDEKNRLGLLLIDSDPENLNSGEFVTYDDNDLVDFYFEDISSLTAQKSSVLIPFRAIITNIGDSTTANWSAQDYLGRADKFWIYQGFQRDVNLSFEVAINSKDEFIESWRKINYLQGMCYPTEYPNNITLKAPIMTLTLGDLFNRVQVILTNISLSFDGSTLWELEKGFQLPMYIKINTAFTVLFADIPKSSARHYAQNQDWISPVVIKYNKQRQSLPDENKSMFVTNNSGSLNLVSQNTSDVNSNSLTKALPSMNSIGNNIPINEKVAAQTQQTVYDEYTTRRRFL